MPSLPSFSMPAMPACFSMLPSLAPVQAALSKPTVLVALVGVALIIMYAFSVARKRAEGFADAAAAVAAALAAPEQGTAATAATEGGKAAANAADAADATFVMYHVSWCPHCRSAKPEFEKLGASVMVGGKKVALKAVNPEEEGEASVQGGPVKGYPTFRLFHGAAAGAAAPVEFTGERTEAAMREFLQREM